MKMSLSVEVRYLRMVIWVRELHGRKDGYPRAVSDYVSVSPDAISLYPTRILIPQAFAGYKTGL